jgi:hypothetical protein
MIEVMFELVGHPDSGKSEVRKHLVNTCGALGLTGIRASGILEEYCEAEGIELSDRASYAKAFKKMNREQSAASRILEKATTPYVVLDGNRYPSVEDELKEKVGSFTSIALHARLSTRLSRARGRGSSKDISAGDIWQFYCDEGPEYFGPNREDNNLIYLIETADHHINADGPIEEMNAAVEAIVLPRLLLAKATNPTE